VNRARWDLCGGRPAMGVPTAIAGGREEGLGEPVVPGAGREPIGRLRPEGARVCPRLTPTHLAVRCGTVGIRTSMRRERR
jgi:hypothetical protein